MTAALLLLLAAAPPLPEHVWLKTPEQQFTSKYELALYGGLIWWKPLGAPVSEWVKLPPAGVPVGKGFKPPAPVMEISADGDNLVAADQAGRIYYAKLDTLVWQGEWGPTFKEGQLFIDFAAGERIAMSHRKMPFEDIDGNPHPIIVGVTTMYVLNGAGTRLEYTDPWLPPEKRHFICLPEHGRFRAAAVSASASTIFVIDAAGNLYTRLADFDSLGLDPILRYGWDRKRRTSALDDDVYSLPPDPWVKQPPVPGPATTAITIAQTGLGNASRELRVGAPDGYWKKALTAPEWEHVVTGAIAPGKTLHPEVDPRLPAHTRTLTGTHEGKPITLDELAPDCSPATLTVEGHALTLHFLQDWEPGHTALTGALYSNGSGLPLFHGRDFIEVELQLHGDAVTLVERFRPRALALRLELAPAK